MRTPEKISTKQESTRLDVQTAIDLQERYNFDSENTLIIFLSGCLDWNYLHAEEIAELAWVELYAEKEEKE